MLVHRMISINITYIENENKDCSWFIIHGEYEVRYNSRIVNLFESYGYTNWCMLGQFIFISLLNEDYFKMILDDDFEDINFIEVIPDYPTDNTLTTSFTGLHQ